MKSRTFAALVLAALLAALLVPALAQAMTYDQAVNKLIKSGWPQAVEKKLVSFQSSSLGFRSGGSPADTAGARYIARQMKDIGLKNVRLEAVPVDVWDFKSASVKVTGLGYSNPVTYTASSFGGVAATPVGGLTGDVVYVHGGSAAEFAAAGDVTGKIVLVDFQSANWWMSYPAMEAGIRHAKAVILTYDAANPGYYGYPTQTALGAFDAESDLSSPPMVYIAWKDGDVLKEALGVGPVSATVKNNVQITMADSGGKGYNVLGELPGAARNGQMVIYGSHHDAWFKGGLDNASAVVNSLLAAKAMKMSGFRPQRTVVFFSSTAEEYGYTNSYYDWCIGAWHAITQKHPDWAGRISVMLNSEILGHKDGNLWMLASPETQPALNAAIAANPALTTWKGAAASILGVPWCWNDQWTFSAAGVPSISFWSQGGDYSGMYKKDIYHTQFDTPALIDWTFFANINKFQFRVAKQYTGDAGLLPYDLAARVNDMAASLDAQIVTPGPTVANVIEGTVDPDVWDAFFQATGRFTAAVGTYEAKKGGIAPAQWPSTNANLMQIEKILNRGFTAMDWLDSTVYPWDQTVRDIFNLNVAIDALETASPDWSAAGGAVGSVGLMWYGTNFSHPVFVRELQRHRDSYYRITWGAQGHLALYQDLTPVMDAITAQDKTAALDGLNAATAEQNADLDLRIIQATDVLDRSADQILDLIPPVMTRGR